MRLTIDVRRDPETGRQFAHCAELDVTVADRSAVRAVEALAEAITEAFEYERAAGRADTIEQAYCLIAGRVGAIPQAL